MDSLLIIDGYAQRCESVTLEMKKCSDTLPKSIWETYSSFANTYGGTIALGFTEENGRYRLSGVDDPEKIVNDFWSLLQDPKKVSVNLLTNKDVRISEYEGTRYILISVPRADRHKRPVFVNGSLENGTYRRNSEGDYHCSVSEIFEMGRDSSESPFDSIAVSELGIDSLCHESIERYKRLIRSANPKSHWLKETEEGLLRLIGATVVDSDGKTVLTKAGLLMFGNERDISFEFPGYHLDYQEHFDDSRWSHRIDSCSGDWSGNVLDFILQVDERLKLLANDPFKLEGTIRIKDTRTLEIQREIVLNSVIHADYNSSGGIRIDCSPTSFNTRNPGTFRIPLELAKSGVYSDPRNPTMMKMLRLIGLVEHSGSGLFNVINNCSELHYETNIEEMMRPAFVKVAIVTSVKKPTASEMEIMIIDAIENDESVSVKTIAELTGKSMSTVNRQIDRMKQKGIIERIDGTRGHWIIKNKDRSKQTVS